MNDEAEENEPAEKKPEEHDRSGGMNFMDKVDAPGSQFAGRDIHNYATTGIPLQEVEKFFVPLIEAVRQAPAENRPQAEAVAEELKKEIAKGDPQSDSRLAKLVDDLLGLVPQAASAIATIFAQPMLAGLAGPVTKFVLAKMGIS